MGIYKSQQEKASFWSLHLVCKFNQINEFHWKFLRAVVPKRQHCKWLQMNYIQTKNIYMLQTLAFNFRIFGIVSQVQFYKRSVKFDGFQMKHFFSLHTIGS